MKTNIYIVAATAALTLLAAPSFAANVAAANAQRIIPLKDGGTLYIFKDGKMAQESRYGRAQRMTMGQTLDAADGQKVVVTSDEVGRLSLLLRQDHRK